MSYLRTCGTGVLILILSATCAGSAIENRPGNDRPGQDKPEPTGKQEPAKKQDDASKPDMAELNAMLAQANAAYDAKEYAKSAELYEKAIKGGATSPNVFYNTACDYALLGKTDDAFRCLNLAIESGWLQLDHTMGDSDLDRLHSDPRWDAALKRCKEENEKFAKSIGQPELREELLKRMREDQAVRTATQPDIVHWRKVDADNTGRMKEVVEKFGWPGKSMVGKDGELAAFLMVQHADADVTFQKKCLDLMKKALESKDVDPGHVAYLTDRVLVAEGKKQLYGTQFYSEFGGELKPRPIEDEANVDARRKEVGLGPLAEYAKQMKSLKN